MSGKAPGRWTRLALVASLGVNLAVAGIVAGAYLQDDDRPVRVAVTPDMRAAISALPEAARENVRAALQAATARDGNARLERIRSARAFAEALRQEPADRAALEAIFAERVAGGDRLRLAAQTALIDTLVGMTLEERIAFLEEMQAKARQNRDGDREGGDRPGERRDGQRPPPRQ